MTGNFNAEMIVSLNMASWKALLFFHVAFLVAMPNCQGSQQGLMKNNFNFSYEPEIVKELKEGQYASIKFNVTCDLENLQNFTIIFKSDNEEIASVSSNGTHVLKNLPGGACSEMQQFSFQVLGRFLGKAFIVAYLDPAQIVPEFEDDAIIDDGVEVIVQRERRVVDDVFLIGMIIILTIIYLGFGCQIRLKVIAKILKKPIEPLIGFAAQFLLMPLIGYGLGKVMKLDNYLAFGLFAVACSPGGGSSNVWTNLLGGNLDLSVTMTFISTIAALGMMPLWMFLVGRSYVDSSIDIPYMDIFQTLLTSAGPCALGVLINHCLPKVGAFLRKITRPFSIILIIYLTIFGAIVNTYLFRIMGAIPLVVPAAMLLPWIGFVFGLVVALICRRERKNAITISIETGYQNTVIAMVMLQGNFPKPEGDIGAAMPLGTAMLTSAPLIIIYCVLLARKCYLKKRKGTEDLKDTEEGQEEEKVPQKFTDLAIISNGKCSIDNGQVPTPRDSENNSNMNGITTGNINQTFDLDENKAIGNGHVLTPSDNKGKLNNSNMNGVINTGNTNQSLDLNENIITSSEATVTSTKI